jgi:hypothetical protein
MARLVDLLNRQARGDFVRGFPAHTELIVADDILQEVEEANRQQRAWSSDDFPRAAPPFPRLWIEGRLDGGRWLGITVSVIEAALVSQETLRMCGVKRSEIKWLIVLFPLVAADEKHGQFRTILVASQLQFICIDGEGRCVAGLEKVIFKPAPDAETALLKKLRLPRMAVSFQVNTAPSVLKIFALMNCVNVAATPVVPPPALNKSHQKKYLAPMSTYKVLTVKGVNISQAGPVRGGTHSTPRRHIVRGHFKHLKSGKTAWWQSFLRGRDDDGAIRKTYSVVKPEAS